MEGWRPSERDELNLSQVKLRMRLGDAGLAAELDAANIRAYGCPSCEHPVAIVRRSSEVRTPEREAALAFFAELTRMPLCDPAVDPFPDCRHCGWKPEHGPADQGGA